LFKVQLLRKIKERTSSTMGQLRLLQNRGVQHHFQHFTNMASGQGCPRTSGGLYAEILSKLLVCLQAARKKTYFSMFPDTAGDA